MKRYRYQYETINGRECCTRVTEWPDGKPSPIDYVESAAGMLQNMVDVLGNHNWVKGPDGLPVWSPVLSDEETNAAKERKAKIAAVTTELSTALVDGGLSVADVVAVIKKQKGASK